MSQIHVLEVMTQKSMDNNISIRHSDIQMLHTMIMITNRLQSFNCLLTYLYAPWLKHFNASKILQTNRIYHMHQ